MESRACRSRDRGTVRRRRRTTRTLRCEALEVRTLLAADLRVAAFTPEPSGFLVEFTDAIDTSVLNLYDAANQSFGEADVSLTGAAHGAVPGSLVAYGQQLRFVSTGGPLPADVYSVRLRSAADGLRSVADGAILDGEYAGVFPSGDGEAGGDFVFTFTAVAPASLVVGLPDFARGPGQAVNVPAADGQVLTDGLPIELSDAAGVTSLTVVIAFDPALLTVSEVQLGPDAPEDSQVTANLTVPGQATIAFFALDPLPTGSARLISLVGEVPAAAPYGAAQAVRITQLEVNAGALPATADDALHAVAFVGDANRNLRYDAEDARLIARVGVGQDSGFAVDPPHGSATSAPRTLYPAIDPQIIGDVTGQGGLSALDASDVLRRVVGLPTPNIPALPNRPPVDILLAPQTVPENAAAGTLVGVLSAVDWDEGDTHSFALAAGDGDADNASVVIVGNQLQTTVTLDFETQSTLQIRVRATDQDGLTLEKALLVTVTNVNETPTDVTLTPASVAENSPLGTVVGQFSAADPDVGDTHTFQLVAGGDDADNAAFVIEGNELKTAAPLDFETKNTYLVRVRATDAGGLSVEQAFTITVTDTVDAPTDVTLTPDTIAEDALVGTLVGLLAAEDPDAGDTHTFELVAGAGDADNGTFVIEGHELRTAALLDFETQSVLQIRVRATDQEGLSLDRELTVTVLDVNEAPTGVTLTPNSVAEDAALGTTVGLLAAIDPDAGDTHVFQFVAGDGDADNEAFLIEGNELKTAVLFDFQTQNEYQVRVRATDQDGLNGEQALLITVTKLNVAPTAVTLTPDTVSENAAVGTLVGLLTADDPDAGDVHTFELVAGEGGTDNGAFVIEGNELKTAVPLDFETQWEYRIRVRATDQEGLSLDKELVVTVLDVNEAPTAVTLTPNAVAEDAPLGTVVGLLAAIDPDAGDTHVFEFVAGVGDADNGAFLIEGNELKTAVLFDFQTQNEYQVRVLATDQDGLTGEQALLISVTKLNVAPTAVALTPDTVPENAAVGTVVGLLTADDPDAGDVHTFELVAGDGDADNAMFVIEGNELKTAVELDYETQNVLQIRVRAADQGGLSVDRELVVTVLDVNEAPTAVTLTPSAVAEDAPLGTVVGLLAAVDPDAGDTHVFQFVAGDGDADNGAFLIEGNELKTAVLFDFQTQNEYQVRVLATDQEGLNSEQALLIAVTKLNEAPTAVTLTPDIVSENAAVGTVVGLLAAADPDAGDVHAFELVAGAGDADNGTFVIEGHELRTAALLDFETQDTLHVRVRATDQGGLSVEQTLVVQVLDEELERPTDVTLTPDTVAEDAAVGTLVGLLAADDPNAGDTHTFELVAGVGDADNESFIIEGNELQTATALDFETQSTYQVRIQATDQGGLTVEKALLIAVTNVNEPPVIHSPEDQTTGVNQPLVFSPGLGNAIVVSDPDALSDDVHVRLLAQFGTASVDEFVGDLDELNQILDGLVFTPDQDFIGDAILDVIADDLGHHGEGGPRTTTARITIAVN